MPDLKLASIDDLLPKQQVIQLPSQIGTQKGIAVKRPDLVNLIMKDGEIINLMRPVIQQWTTVSDGSESNIERVFELLTLVPELEPRFNKVVMATVVAPVLNDDQVKQLTIRDRVQVVMWAVGEEFGEINNFLRESAARVSSVSGVTGLQHKPGQPATHKK